MNTPGQALAQGVRAASNAFLFFSDDLAGGDWTHRVCKDASCAAWIVGHLILSARNMARAMGADLTAPGVPALPDGFEARFARNEAAARASDFGDTAILRDLFKTHHDFFARQVERLPTDKLAEKLSQPTPMFTTVGELAAFAPTHIGMHLGQISTIRRSLGRPPLV